MGKSSDQLREEIDQQRDDAGAKIDRLQRQVEGQIEDTREQVVDTAEQVRDEAKAMVTDTVDSVKETVENLDIERHVQERPLVSVGAALVGGFLLGAVLGGDDDHHRHSGGYSAAGSMSGQGHDHGGPDMSGMMHGIRSAAKKSGLEDTVSNAAAAMMGSVTEQIKDMLDRGFPGFSEKLDTAEHQQGSFTDKTRATQREAQQM
jgi:ElaB/YqjD/DUF883 family membrane-anchored ribosome-binding protein